MKTVLELTLSHDGCHWITDDMGCQLRGKDLEHLEANITNYIKINTRFLNKETIDVTLRFDMACFPGWLTQYQSHYFNYTFTVSNQQQIKS